MCQFCVEHGDGKKWYLEAANYAFDLESDLKRRGYIVDLARDFHGHARRLLTGLRLLKPLPGPVRSYGHAKISRYLQRNHFGQVVPIEDCDKIFDIATSVVRVPCLCRRVAGKGEHALCLLMTTRPITDLSADSFVRELAGEVLPDFGDGPDLAGFELLTKTDALAMLERCEEDGLMHSVWTFITPFIAAMCNCNLPSGCKAMQVTLDYGLKAMWKGEYVAGVDGEACNGCRECVDLCPFDAMRFDGVDKKAAVRLDACYGCGVCRRACPTDAISLAERSAVPGVAASW